MVSLAYEVGMHGSDREYRSTFLSVTYQSPLGLDERPVLSIHLVIESAGIAEVMSVSVPTPQRGGRSTTVHTLATL